MPTDYPETAVAAQPVLAGSICNDATIRKCSNGFIVNVGCKTFVAKTFKEVSEGLELYFKDPNAARVKYCEDEKLNKVRR